MTLAQIVLLAEADRRINNPPEVQRETGTIGDLLAARAKVAG